MRCVEPVRLMNELTFCPFVHFMRAKIALNDDGRDEKGDAKGGQWRTSSRAQDDSEKKEQVTSCVPNVLR